jgi:hypothetical protein
MENNSTDIGKDSDQKQKQIAKKWTSHHFFHMSHKNSFFYFFYGCCVVWDGRVGGRIFKGKSGSGVSKNAGVSAPQARTEMPNESHEVKS